MSMIALKDVALTLAGRTILKDISFDVRSGETMVILGGSGSGKTTILRLILGLYRADRGSIRVAGEEITQLHERDLPRIRQKMAMVFQGAALFDSLTVRENVGYRLLEQGRGTDEAIEQTVCNSLRFVGLEDTLGKMPAELSGGMRKRVGIARALASGATLLLYDEPTAGLDPINTFMINRVILQLKDRGVTQVVVTHDLETAYRIADRIIMIQKTRVVFEGKPEELRHSMDSTIRSFLDPAATLSAGGAFPKCGE
jgi:phospholipid/cholesterol/gamma-HCH transport system ATP-binding protein